MTVLADSRVAKKLTTSKRCEINLLKIMHWNMLLEKQYPVENSYYVFQCFMYCYYLSQKFVCSVNFIIVIDAVFLIKNPIRKIWDLDAYSKSQHWAIRNMKLCTNLKDRKNLKNLLRHLN